MLKEKFLEKAILLVMLAAVPLVSCSDKEVQETVTPGSFFLSVNGESAEYIMQTDILDSGAISITKNVATLEKTGHTWIFNENPSVAIGLIYQQGDPGIGLGYGVDNNLELKSLGNFQISSRYTTYGFFNGYAVTSVGGQTLADAQGNAQLDANGNPRSDGVTFNLIKLGDNLSLSEKTIPTLNIAGNGLQATLSGIVDIGNGEFLSGMVLSTPKDPSQGGGASSGVISYPDSVWVAAFDEQFNLKRIYRDNRISYSSGRYRSQYYSQIAKADDGTVYVFSGSYESTATNPCGALRITRGATAFDPQYYFNIGEKNGGYKFRKVWHITGNSFMLELYNDLEVSPQGAATQYAIVDVNAKTFKKIAGIPAKELITGTGTPMAYNGKMYFPIVEEGKDPAVYVIDPTTSTAKKGLSIKGATSLNAIGRLVP